MHTDRPAHPFSPDASGSGARAPRMLVAEDNAVNQLVARRLLERLGGQVVVASSGVEAASLRTLETFDLIFMDCAMPDVDGFEATRRIRAWEAEARSRRVPIVAMTANVMPGIAEACAEAGMDDYVSKPLTGAALEQTLARWWRMGVPR
jgi:CheY-like chemotaxis protein